MIAVDTKNRKKTNTQGDCRGETQLQEHTKHKVIAVENKSSKNTTKHKVISVEKKSSKKPKSTRLLP